MRAVGFALLLPLAGCVLLVPDIEPGDHCTFEGATPCAACLREKCQAPIDACCGAKTCREGAFDIAGIGATMTAIDTCGRGLTSICASSLESADKTTEGNAVNNCVLTSCRDQCAPGATATKWTCEAPRDEKTECAKCIYGKCGSEITTCCASSSCAKYYGVEEDLAVCIGEDSLGCAYRVHDVQVYSGSTVTASDAVRQCIADACTKPCTGDGGTHRRCTAQNGEAYCSCTDAETPSGPPCSAESTTDGACFRTKGGCLCGHYGCTLTDDGRSPARCECDFAGSGAGAKAERCNPSLVDDPAVSGLGVCCLVASATTITCGCYAAANQCESPGVKVDSCDRRSLFDGVLEASAVDVCSQ